MRRLLRPMVVMLAVLLAGGAAQARSLRDQIPDALGPGFEAGDAFDALSDAIADSAARNLPIVSASAGFTYRYNPALEVFERTSETLGPIFLERPDTIGRGKINVNVSYQYVELNEIDGEDMDSLEAPDPIIVRVVPPGGILTGFAAERLRYRLNLVNHVVGLSATYGVLDDLDVNILLPLIATEFDTTAERQRRFEGPCPPGTAPCRLRDVTFVPVSVPPEPPGTIDGDAFGVGDILLRAKYQLPRVGGLRLAPALQLRLPSGDEDDFQGTGTFEASPLFYASTRLWGRVEPHANVGVDLRADDVGDSQGRYAIGVDADITRRVGVALGFLGRSQFSATASEDETSFRHLTPAGPQRRPLLGIEFDRKDFFDLSFGLRAVVWRELMVFANGIYALNDDGLRNDTIIPTVGFEGTF